MSMHLLATGALVSDPARRTGASGAEFATATLRVSTDGGAILVSLIAFRDRAAALLELKQGDAVAASGRASLRSWTGKDGVEKHGMSIAVDKIASAAAARQADARGDGRSAMTPLDAARACIGRG